MSTKNFASVSALSKSQENSAVRNILDLTGGIKQQCKVFSGLRKQSVPVDKKGNCVLIEAFMAEYGCPFNKAGNITPAAVQSACAEELKLVEGKYVHMWVFKNRRVCLLSDDSVKLFRKVIVDGNETYVPAFVYAPKEVANNKWSARTIMTLLRQSYHIKDELVKSEESVAVFEKTEVFYRESNDGEKNVYIEVKASNVIF